MNRYQLWVSRLFERVRSGLGVGAGELRRECRRLLDSNPTWSLDVALVEIAERRGIDWSDLWNEYQDLTGVRYSRKPEGVSG